jgi:hypothetical protein
MVAVGKVQSAKELLVGDVALAYKYKYTKEQIAIDATWEITPVLTLLASVTSTHVPILTHNKNILDATWEIMPVLGLLALVVQQYKC